jgi:hypothetical protein
MTLWIRKGLDQGVIEQMLREGHTGVVCDYIADETRGGRPEPEEVEDVGGFTPLEWEDNGSTLRATGRMRGFRIRVESQPRPTRAILFIHLLGGSGPLVGREEFDSVPAAIGRAEDIDWDASIPFMAREIVRAFS